MPVSGRIPTSTTNWGSAACKFGLGGGRWKFRSEQIDVEDILRGAQVYALAALEICNWEKLPA